MKGPQAGAAPLLQVASAPGEKGSESYSSISEGWEGVCVVVLMCQSQQLLHVPAGKSRVLEG